MVQKREVKVSDYIISFLAQLGVRELFVIVGHGNLHLLDSLGRNKQLNYIGTQNEQAAAVAAEAYAKITGGYGAAIVTSGPGGTNAVTGVASAWLDSVPVIFISGQVNYRESIRETKVRQFGVQEINIVDIVRPITKYAVTVSDPEKIRYHMEKAAHRARAGRPGPVWLDIPLDIQHQNVDLESLESYRAKIEPIDRHEVKVLAQKTAAMIKESQRLVILAGAGIKRAAAKKVFLELTEKLACPVVCTYSAADLLPDRSPFSIGRAGINGSRAPNLAVQNSDLLLSLGSRLNTTQTSSFPETYARAAKKIVCDIDPAELNKNWVKADLAVNLDVGVFLQELLNGKK